MFTCCAEFCEFLSELKKQFTSTIILKNIDWQKLVNHLKNLEYDACCQHQELLLKSTIQHPIILKYPIKKSYQKEFLKTFIKKIEEQNIEVDDGVYEALINILSTNSAVEEEVHYRHFIINDRFITLKENTCFISQGTTGLITWQAGIALANWCIKNSELFKGKKIVELGCGVGLTGLAIVYSGIAPKSYLFTDYHPTVLQNLNLNINLNSATSSNFPKVIEDIEVDVLEIDWNIIDEVKFNFENIDIILAADVIYDPYITASFCKALNYLIGNSEKQAIVACTERDPETIRFFKNLLESNNLKIIKEIYESYESISALFLNSFDTVIIFYIVKSC